MPNPRDHWKQYPSAARVEKFYAGGVKRSEFFRDMASAYTRNHMGDPPSLDYDSDFTRLLMATYRDEFEPDPDGAFADLLVEVGLRDEDWDFEVGKTP